MKKLFKYQIFPDKNANRGIGKLEVNCPSTGCEWDGTLNSLLQVECKYKLVVNMYTKLSIVLQQFVFYKIQYLI